MPASKGMYLAYCFQALIAVNVVYAFYKGQFGEFFTGVLVFVLTFVPYMVAHRLDVRFPWFVYFLIALSLWVHIAGYVQGWYVSLYPYYDKVGHFISASSIALLGFLGVIFLDRYWRMHLTPLFIAGFTVIFGLALGGLWEIYEFVVDLLFGGFLNGPMQNGLDDTMWDMIADLVGSVVVGLIAIAYFRHHRVQEVEDSMDVEPSGIVEATDS